LFDENNTENYDTDKLALKYLKTYEEYFGSLLDKDIRLLELGVFKGGSLLLWRDYFKKGTIIGLDFDPCPIKDKTGRIRFYQGQQEDTALLDRIARETAPDGFDVIIDDCSHIGEFTRMSFWHLFERHLKPGGLYSIEDWGTGYWGEWPDGKRFKQPQWPSGMYKTISRTAAFIEKITHRKINARWLSRTYKLAYYKQRLPSHEYGMVGFIKQLIDEAGMGDITCPDRGIGPCRPSKFEKIHISHGQVIIIKSKS
jgi:SAM-dependent methyltransferase